MSRRRGGALGTRVATFERRGRFTIAEPLFERGPSSRGVSGSSTALTSGLIPLLASEVPSAVKYSPTVRSSAPPAARWITSWKVPFPNERVPTIVAR